MTKNLVESWLPLAKLRGSVKAQWHTLPISFGGSGSNISNLCEAHIDNFNAGAKDWLVHNFEQDKDFFEYQTQHPVSTMHQSAKVTTMILTMDPS